MMSSALRRAWRRVAVLGLVAVVVATLTACKGIGGGQLPPQSPLYAGAASFGFTFSCERSSQSTGTKAPAGRLKIELSYTDHGTNPLGAGFSVHGIVDTLDPVLESAICIGQNPPPGGNELIFLGRYRPTTSVPAGFLPSCATRTPVCRFEVIVRDNDSNRAPSPGDYFQITLSGTTAVTSTLDAATVFYTRGGTLQSGNLTVN